MKVIKSIAEINMYNGANVNPLKSPDTVYELYSVPSFDNNYPEIIKGTDIGSSKITVEENDVLICKINPRINRVWVVKHNTEHQLLASSEWIVVRSVGVDPLYLKWYFSSPTFRNYMTSQTAGIGGSLTRAQPKQVAKYPVPIPTVNEQGKIVSTLNNVDNCITLRKKQISKLDELIKSQFIEMFGDPVTNSNGWETHQFSEYIQFLTSGSRGWSKYFSNSGEMFITIKNVKNCQISTDNMQFINAPKNAEAIRTRVQEGDLLISVTADLGRTGVVTKSVANFGAYINQHLTIVRLDKNVLNPYYAAWFMESPAGKCQFESKNQNAVKAGLNFNSISTLKILVPPIALQNLFVSFVQQVDKSKFEIGVSLEKLEVLKNALMQESFG